MALDASPDIRCTRTFRHPGEAPPAVAFIHDPEIGHSRSWRPRCDPCVLELADNPDPVPYHVAYLDPTRQRRPQPDHHDPADHDPAVAADDRDRGYPADTDPFLNPRRCLDMAKPQHPPTYLRTVEAAAILCVSPKTVSRWAKEGQIPFLRTLGGHRRYPEVEIRQLLADNTIPADNQ